MLFGCLVELLEFVEVGGRVGVLVVPDPGHTREPQQHILDYLQLEDLV